MTIKELKSLFTSDTDITIVSQDDDSIVSVSLTHLLLGCPTFAEMPLMLVQAVGENKVVVEVDMPVEVFRAWKNYSNDYYKE